MDSRPSRLDPNRGPRKRREPMFNLAGVISFFILLCTLVHLVRLYLLTPIQDGQFLLFSAFIPLRYSGMVPVDISTLISPVTYSFLHANAAHLLINMIWLAAFGSPLAVRIGPARTCLFWMAGSVFAAGAHLIVYPDSLMPMIGASGAVSAMMGAAARFGFRIDSGASKRAFSGPVLSARQVFASRTVISFLAIWMVINLISGLGFLTPGMDSTIAWEAHIGGFVAGFFGIALFVRNH